MPKHARFISMAACAVLLLHALAQAQPVQHPAYLRALAELRYARAYLHGESADGATVSDEQRAIEQIDKAMKDVRDASEDDGKTLDDHPPVEANQDHAQRLQSALAQLDRAHGDIELREQDSFWKGLKANDAQDRIDEAKQAIRQEMNRASH